MKTDTYIRIRRFVDVFAATILLIAVAPLLLGIVVAVRMRMGAPVMFRQARQGHRGPFELLKFRTMVNGAEQLGGGYMPAHLDLVPPLGRFLRRTSLDELPQLINIIRGDMAFVGPRPALLDQVARYSDEQRGRLQVPQGITGLAQVRYRNEAPWSVRIESDLEYVRGIGPMVDLRIVGTTIRRVTLGAGVRQDQTAHEVDDLGPGVAGNQEKTL